jgi:GT2 family glycosyltransferase
MKAWARGELASYIWEDNKLLGQTSPSLKANVLDAVGQSHSKPNVVDYFPNTEAGERASYPGFAWLFNEMAKAYHKKSKLTSRSQSAIRDLLKEGV